MSKSSELRTPGGSDPYKEAVEQNLKLRKALEQSVRVTRMWHAMPKHPGPGDEQRRLALRRKMWRQIARARAVAKAEKRVVRAAVGCINRGR